MRIWALALLVACGGDNTSSVDASTVLPDAFVPDGAPGGPGTALSHTLFVNADGVTITMGSADDATTNVSTIPTTASTALTAYLAADASRDMVISGIKQQLDGILSPYNISVTLTRPASGPYDMVVLTDDSGAKLGLSQATVAVVPTSCNTVASEIGFVFPMGGSRDLVVAQTIAMFGITGGIPASSKTGDCMCIDPSCGQLTAPCTIGKANTPISSQQSCQMGGETTMDEDAKFLAAYGPH